MNSLNRINIGVIGVGNMGKNHVRLTSEMVNTFNLIGVYDVDINRVLSTGYKGKIFEDYNDLMKSVDAVVIAAPSSLHKQIALDAAKHNIHALVEKPLALSQTETEQINSAYNKLDKVLMVGHVERFNPVILELEKIIKQEEILAVSIERCSPMDLHINDTDVINDLMVHDMDILINSINSDGKIIKMHSLGHPVYNKDYADYVQTMLEFDNGILANITASRITENKIRSLRIHCKESFIDADLLNKTINITRKTKYKLDVGYDPSYRQENLLERVFVPNTESLKNELLHFAKCINENCICMTDGITASECLAVLDKIRSDISK